MAAELFRMPKQPRRRKLLPRKAMIKGAIFRVLPPTVEGWADKFDEGSYYDQCFVNIWPRTRSGIHKQLGAARTFCSTLGLPVERISIQISTDQGETWSPVTQDHLRMIRGL